MSNVATSGSASPSHDTEPFPNSSSPGSPAFSSADEHVLGNHTVRRVSVAAWGTDVDDKTPKSRANCADGASSSQDVINNNNVRNKNNLPFSGQSTPVQQQQRTPTNAGRSADPPAPATGILTGVYPERTATPTVNDSGRSTPTAAAIASLMSGFTQFTGQQGGPVPGPVVEAISEVVEEVTEAAGWRLSPAARYVLIVICCVAFSVGSLYISSLIASHSK